MSIPNEDNLPDSIATPEGDNEASPDTPLDPNAEAVLPPGAAQSHSDSNKIKPTGVEKFIDEIVRGEYM